jgi:hypothetical protein
MRSVLKLAAQPDSVEGEDTVMWSRVAYGVGDNLSSHSAALGNLHREPCILAVNPCTLLCSCTVKVCFVHVDNWPLLLPE